MSGVVHYPACIWLATVSICTIHNYVGMAWSGLLFTCVGVSVQCLTHTTPSLLPPFSPSLSPLPSSPPFTLLPSPPFPSPPFLPSLPHFTHILVEYCHSGAVERVSRGLQNFCLSATTLTYTTLLPAQHTNTHTHGVEDQDQDRVIIVFYK